MRHKIIENLRESCPWQDSLIYFESIDSTNTRAKELAKEGAPHGTVLVAGHQTAGRGRMGRSFSSPDGMGVYLSVILRPNCTPDKLMHLTCATAVASCKAVENACGVCPGIKWTNDLVCGKKKLGGILTELSVDSTTGLVFWAVVGIGINCNQQPEDFSAELRDMATSISQLTGTICSPFRLAAALTEALYQMDTQLLSGKKQLMDEYRKHCITLGKDIVVVRGEDIQYGKALELDDDGGLLVRFTDGQERIVSSGEVSVRGMYGYL